MRLKTKPVPRGGRPDPQLSVAQVGPFARSKRDVGVACAPQLEPCVSRC